MCSYSLLYLWPPNSGPKHFPFLASQQGSWVHLSWSWASGHSIVEIHATERPGPSARSRTMLTISHNAPNTWRLFFRFTQDSSCLHYSNCIQSNPTITIFSFTFRTRKSWPDSVGCIEFNLWSAILCDGPNAISRSSNQLAEEIHDLVRHWAAFLYKMALLSISSNSILYVSST